jgi:hypothetical protein
MQTSDRDIEKSKQAAKIQLAERARLADELDAIQKELERRASLGKPSGDKPWTSRKQSP